MFDIFIWIISISMCKFSIFILISWTEICRKGLLGLQKQKYVLTDTRFQQQNNI